MILYFKNVNFKNNYTKVYIYEVLLCVSVHISCFADHLFDNLSIITREVI